MRGDPYLKEESFGRSIGELKGAKIGLYLNCNQFIKGTLLEVKQDHLVVDVNDIVHYFSLHQIHVLSKDATDIRNFPKTIPYFDRDRLTDVLKDLKYNWVTINSLSQQFFVGLLSRIADDHIILISNGEQFYIQNSFISNIYKGNYKIEEVSQIPLIQSNDKEASLSTIEKEQEHPLEDKISVQTNHSKKANVDDFQIDNPESSPMVNFINEPNVTISNNKYLLDKTLSIDVDQPPSPAVDSSIDLNPSSLLRSNVDYTGEGKISNVVQTNKKRVPITFNTIFNDQLSNTKENIPINDTESISDELTPFKRDFETLVENDSANGKFTQLPSEETNSKEEKMILEKQYFALMKHAEKMYHKIRDERLKK